MKASVFYEEYEKVLQLLLGRSSVKVMCLDSDPDVVVGYAVLTPDETALHWIFVKKAWRKMGIAKALIPQSTSKYTHTNKLGIALKPKEWEFNPFYL
jgi:GNAT superfamily N-acetyltransferase